MINCNIQVKCELKRGEAVMNESCEYCKYYDEDNPYEGTGYCVLYSTYIKNADYCEDYEEVE